VEGQVPGCHEKNSHPLIRPRHGDDQGPVRLRGSHRGCDEVPATAHEPEALKIMLPALTRIVQTRIGVMGLFTRRKTVFVDTDNLIVGGGWAVAVPLTNPDTGGAT
jgi:hypothetical protein